MQNSDRNRTDHFAIVIGDFGTVTVDFGDVTDRRYTLA